MKDPQALLSQDALQSSRPSNLNLYPRKRELEAQISAANEDLAKSNTIFLFYLFFPYNSLSHYPFLANDKDNIVLNF